MLDQQITPVFDPNHISRLAKARGITEYGLCKRCAISPDTFRRLRRSTVNARVGLLITLADALDVSMDELLQRREYATQGDNHVA